MVGDFRVEMSLKLLFVNASLTDGGSERAMSLVAQALAAHSHDVEMVLVREKDQTYTVDPRVKISQMRFGLKSKVLKPLSRIRQLRRMMRTGHHDYIVCYMWDINVMTLLASLGLGRRVVVSERAFPGASTRSGFTRALERFTYRLAYRIVYQTDYAREFCPPYARNRSVVVPNMILPCESPASGVAREKRIVSVGRLTRQKNFPLLLRSFARFKEECPDWTLEIYGRGPLEAHLKALAEELGISESVVFAGYVGDVLSRIQNAGMFVLSSDYEGISNAMTEAMSLGLPVVCTDCPVGGAALMISDQESGLLVPVGDEDALTLAMNKVALDNDLTQRISAGAQESVARFAPEKLAEVWEREVLSSKRV